MQRQKLKTVIWGNEMAISSGKVCYFDTPNHIQTPICELTKEQLNEWYKPKEWWLEEGILYLMKKN